MKSLQRQCVIPLEVLKSLFYIGPGGVLSQDRTDDDLNTRVRMMPLMIEGIDRPPVLLSKRLKENIIELLRRYWDRRPPIERLE